MPMWNLPMNASKSTKERHAKESQERTDRMQWDSISNLKSRVEALETVLRKQLYDEQIRKLEAERDA